MQLSERLECVLAMTPHCIAAADIGTDHAFTPIELVRRGIAERALAMDVRKGPLQTAAQHVREAGLEDRIELRLSDGLSGLLPGEAEVIVMTGMGGPLMQRLLTEGAETALSAQRLILSPQSDIPAFRAFLMENGYRIEAERMVEEDGKFYLIERVVPAAYAAAEAAWTQEELDFGRDLLAEKSPVLKRFLLKELKIARTIREKLADSRQAERLAEVTARIREISGVLSRVYGEPFS